MQIRPELSQIVHIVHIIAPIAPSKNAQRKPVNKGGSQQREDALLKSLRRVRPPMQIRLCVNWEALVPLFMPVVRLLSTPRRRG